MTARAPLSFRIAEAVEARLRRHASPATLRRAYRLGYLVLRPWWFVTRPRTLGVKAVVRRGDDVLLVRHSYARRDQWDIPGGFLRPGEDPRVALFRELEEELGIRPQEATLIAETPSRNDHKREILRVFAVDVEDPTTRPSPAELAEVGWFHHRALPAGATGHARRMVARAYWELWDDEAERVAPGATATPTQ
jgi:ADP-ribose pyrophosphatase YjhB (NUDIX family)